MEKGPWREFLIGVVAPLTVALGVYYGVGLGRPAIPGQNQDTLTH